MKLCSWLALVPILLPVAAFAADPILTGLEGEYHTYVLAKPVDLSVALGPFSQAGHYAVHSAFVVGKIWIAAKGGTLALQAAGLEQTFFSGPRTVFGELPALTYTDLLLRERLKLRKAFQELSELPGIDGYEVTSIGNVGFKGTVAVSDEARGVVVIRSKAPLVFTPAQQEKWGAPIEVKTTSDVRLNFSLGTQFGPAKATWNPTLLEASSGETLPKEVADQWRGEVNAEETRTFKNSELDLSVHVDDESGNAHDIPFGRVQGYEGVKAFLNKNLKGKALNRVGEEGKDRLSSLTTLNLTRPPPVERSNPSHEGHLNTVVGRLPLSPFEVCIFSAFDKLSRAAQRVKDSISGE